MRFTIEITRRTTAPAPSQPPPASPPLPAETSRIDWRPFPYERRNPERRGHGDTVTGLARFSGPGPAVDHTMTKGEARAIAQALGVAFEATTPRAIAPTAEEKILQNYDS